MTWLDHHSVSERFAADAALAARGGDLTKAGSLYRQAAEEEVRALEAVDPSKTRTLGITAVSATALWFKAGEHGNAEQLAYRWLSLPQIPAFAADQLRQILQTIWAEVARERAGVKFTGGEVLVAVRGGEILPGGAPLDLIVSKVTEVQALFYRTAEFLLHAPHRKRGAPPLEIQELCRPWLLQAAPSSYQFAVRVQEPPQQPLFPDRAVHAEKIANTFLEIVRATAEDPDTSLATLVPDPQYRSTFLKLTRNLAPTGKLFGELEVRSASPRDARSILLSPGSRELISDVLRRETRPPDTEKRRQVQLRGILRALHLDKDWLELFAASPEGETHIKIYGAGDALDDVIGPMVNHVVVVDAFVGRFGRHYLRDIQPEG